MSRENELAKKKIYDLLYPRSPSLEEMVLEGAKYGGMAGVGLGVILPIMLKGRVHGVTTFAKSVMNMVFLGSSFMACKYFTDYKLLAPPLTGGVIAGALTGGICSGVMNPRTIPMGIFSGSIIGGIGAFGYKYSGIQEKNFMRDVGSLQDLVEKYPQVELTKKDQKIYYSLLQGVDKRKKRIQEPFSFSKLLSILNPMKELSELDKQELLKKKDTIVVDLKKKDRDTTLKFGGIEEYHRKQKEKREQESENKDNNSK